MTGAHALRPALEGTFDGRRKSNFARLESETANFLAARIDENERGRAPDRVS